MAVQFYLISISLFHIRLDRSLVVTLVVTLHKALQQKAIPGDAAGRPRSDFVRKIDVRRQMATPGDWAEGPGN